MSTFRHKPSHRRKPKLQASWLVVGYDTSRHILYHGRTAHIQPVRSSDHHKRYTPGQRLAVKAFVGGPTECHAHVLQVDRIQLGDIDYPTVRELGYIRVDEFREAFDGPDHKWVWVLRFAVDRTLPDRFLAQNSEEGYTESAARALKDEPPALHDHEWKDHVGSNLERTHEEWLALSRDRARKHRPPKHLRKAA